MIAIVGLTVALAVAGAATVAVADFSADADYADHTAAHEDDSSLEWQAKITVEKNGEVIEEHTNQLTHQGADFIAKKISPLDEGDWTDLGSSASGALVETMALSNDADYVDGTKTVDADDTSLDGEIIDEGTGLTRVWVNDADEDSEIDGQSLGNFDDWRLKIEHTFTADAQEDVYATALHWSCHGGQDTDDACDTADTGSGEYDTETMISGAAFDNEAVLEQDDELTVTHEIELADG